MPLISFVRKLHSLASLEHREAAIVDSLRYDRMDVDRKHDLLKHGESSKRAFILMDGWAARYSPREGASRRITRIMLPGDHFALHAMAEVPMDGGILALNSCKFAAVEINEFFSLLENHRIRQAISRADAAEAAAMRRLLVKSTDSYTAVAHLICELHARASVIGLAHGGRLASPLNQDILGDALGITAVHVNRMIGALRRNGLLDWRAGTLYLKDVEALRQVAQFSADYLHAA